MASSATPIYIHHASCPLLLHLIILPLHFHLISRLIISSYFLSHRILISLSLPVYSKRRARVMDGDMDWIAARFLLSAILGVHPLVAVDDGGDDEHFPVDGSAAAPRRVLVPAAVEAPEEVAGAVCAVCTEEMAARQAVVRLPCAHWYHDGCIAPWLRIRTTCPTCRAELPREGGGRAERPRPPRVARAVAETAGGRLRREASYTMLAGTLPS